MKRTMPSENELAHGFSLAVVAHADAAVGKGSGIAVTRPTITVPDVTLNYLFKAKVKRHCACHPGKIKPAEDIIVTNTDAEFNRRIGEIEAHEDARIADGTTLEEAARWLLARPFPMMLEKGEMRPHPKRVAWIHDCEGCLATGTITCTGCGGQCWFECDDCGTTGKKSCSCGNGRVSKYVEINGEGRNVTVDCETCGGTGRRNCSSCGGGGHLRCGTCHARGRIGCPICLGKRIVTDVARIHIQLKPKWDFVHQSNSLAPLFNSIRLQELEQYAILEPGQHVSSPAHRSFMLRYSVKLPIAEAPVWIDGQQSRWTLYGINPKVWCSGYAYEPILQPRLEALELLNTKPYWLPGLWPVTLFRLHQLMKAKINRDAVQAYGRHWERARKQNMSHDERFPHALEKAREEMHNAFSSRYIDYLVASIMCASGKRLKLVNATDTVLGALLITPLTLLLLLGWMSEPMRAEWLAIASEFTTPSAIAHPGALAALATVSFLAAVVASQVWMRTAHVRRKLWFRLFGGKSAADIVRIFASDYARRDWKHARIAAAAGVALQLGLVFAVPGWLAKVETAAPAVYGGVAGTVSSAKALAAEGATKGVDLLASLAAAAPAEAGPADE